MDFASIFPFATEVGYIGLSLVSFFGSLIPFVPLPSFLLLATMSVGDKFDLHLLAILSAVTATAAKVIVFSVSYEGRRIMSEKARKRMRPFERLVKRYGAGAAFFADRAKVFNADLIWRGRNQRQVGGNRCQANARTKLPGDEIAKPAELPQTRINGKGDQKVVVMQ